MTGSGSPWASARSSPGPCALRCPKQHNMGVRSLLLCGVSIAFPLLVTADACKDENVQNETVAEDQPFAFNCTLFPTTNGVVNVTWHKTSSKIALSKDIQLRIHQEHTWILFLPLAQEDSGIYHCVIKNTDGCYRIPLNLTVFKKHWCDPSRRSPANLSDDYIQILPTGKSGSLTCHMHFPKSCVLDSVKWYKGCEEIKAGKQFAPSRMRLLVYHTSAEDGGSYACTARLTHAGRTYLVRNSIIVSTRVGSGRRIPNITYPRNNSIEVRLGSILTVDCNITDVKENTNRRCWRVNNTLVNDNYSSSKRIREGIESNVSYTDHIFYTVNITFLEVKMEDYGHPFTCHAGMSSAYIILRLPAPDFEAYLIGGLVTLVVLVVLVLCIYHNFKIDIVLWYRRAFLSTRAIEDGKLYDAYVLYPKCPQESQGHDVDTLVLKLLPEVLEKQCGYKLFIFGRDEFPGQAVANVIDESVKLCRRLIVTVVPAYPSFGLLNMSAEQIAIYNALIQDGMKVILIELGKVEDYGTLPESIQYIRQKHGAIQWRGDFTEQSQCAKSKFWKKVRYCMPPRRYSPSSSVQLQEHTPCDGTAGE
uniref:interleukin-1 receptor-like 2 isoform X2 n=1 Tax=Jaculus jaculus TaxID=51337 RepID=UPI001E1AF6F4|nr:interleukin-1 receptor-like 2 isoform X2 [Jaculus jaculus]